MKNMRSVVTTVMLIAVMPLVPAFAEDSSTVEIEYLDDADNMDIRSILIEDGVLDDGVEFINETFRLEQTIKVTVGAAEGPLYDPGVSEIQIPYSFYTEIIDRFSAIEKDSDEQAVFASDAMLHTLFHELGHALVDQLELPIVGKEEDAVDALASVLLLEHYNDGAEMAGNAAELFALEGEDRGDLEQEDFWDEHSLDEQRYFSMLCHIYGSDPDAFTDLAEDIGFSADRREICVETYERLVDDWGVLLEPVFKGQK